LQLTEQQTITTHPSRRTFLNANHPNPVDILSTQAAVEPAAATTPSSAGRSTAALAIRAEPIAVSPLADHLYKLIHGVPQQRGVLPEQPIARTRSGRD